MKATGIVRRIDDLGRIVIPKELRRSLRLSEGESLEIFTGDAGEIMLKKHSSFAGIEQYAQIYAEALSAYACQAAVFTDTEKVIAAAAGGAKAGGIGEALDDDFYRIFTDRCQNKSSAETNAAAICAGFVPPGGSIRIIMPITCFGDCIGTAAVYQTEENKSLAAATARTAAAFFSGIAERG